MTTVIRVGSLRELESRIKRDAAARAQRVVKAIQATAAEAAPKIQQDMPEAFGRLKKQLATLDTAAGATIRDDAPYAAAVELGSRPHTVPLDALIDWVLVKGFASDMKQARAIAIAVQRKIQADGTAPKFYMRSSLPAIKTILDARIRAALPDPT